VHDFFPCLVKPTVAAAIPLAQRTVSGAHRIVCCGLVTVGSGHTSPVDCVLITLPTVGADTVGSPDSPVHTGQSGEF
jgi:hypothetical protein